MQGSGTLGINGLVSVTLALDSSKLVNNIVTTKLFDFLGNIGGFQ
jgi:hypothetical protein